MYSDQLARATTISLPAANNTLMINSLLRQIIRVSVLDGVVTFTISSYATIKQGVDFGG